MSQSLVRGYTQFNSIIGISFSIIRKALIRIDPRYKEFDNLFATFLIRFATGHPIVAVCFARTYSLHIRGDDLNERYKKLFKMVSKGCDTYKQDIRDIVIDFRWRKINKDEYLEQIEECVDKLDKYLSDNGDNFLREIDTLYEIDIDFTNRSTKWEDALL